MLLSLSERYTLLRRFLAKITFSSGLVCNWEQVPSDTDKAHWHWQIHLPLGRPWGMSAEATYASESRGSELLEDRKGTATQIMIST